MLFLSKVASTPPKISVKKFDIDIKTLAVDVELVTVEPLVLKGKLVVTFVIFRPKSLA